MKLPKKPMDSLEIKFTNSALCIVVLIYKFLILYISPVVHVQHLFKKEVNLLLGVSMSLDRKISAEIEFKTIQLV